MIPKTPKLYKNFHIYKKYFDMQTKKITLQEFKNVVKNILKEEMGLEEISSDMFKRTMAGMRDKKHDERSAKLGGTFFREFEGKPLMGGTIVRINAHHPSSGDYFILRVVVEKEDRYGGMHKPDVAEYDVTNDKYNIEDTPVSRADARALSLIAQKINPDTKYRTSSAFTIKGY